MSTKWCHNAKTGEIFSYEVSGGLTDFCRGTLLAYGDYLTTGFKNRAEAIKWSKKYGTCRKCKSSRSPNANGKCDFCGTKIEFVSLKS
jgi:hypothetical protein